MVSCSFCTLVAVVALVASVHVVLEGAIRVAVAVAAGVVGHEQFDMEEGLVVFLTRRRRSAT